MLLHSAAMGNTVVVNIIDIIEIVPSELIKVIIW